MTRTWKPTVAGVLDIVSGVHGLVGAGVLFALAGLVSMEDFLPRHGHGYPFFLTNALFTVLGLFQLFAGLVAIIGGSFALQRSHWGWALAGAIGALFTSVVWGIPSIILTAMSEPEFKEEATAAGLPGIA